MTPSPLSESAQAIERLLTVCADGVAGYRVAAASVQTPHLHALLQRNEVEREEIYSVLTNVLVDLGAHRVHAGSLTAAIHRGWLGALSASHADDAIVRECLRGDQVTLAAFAEALSHELPDAIQVRVQAQLSRVIVALERLSTSAAESKGLH